MATISSHTLDGTDGTHAGGVAVKLVNINTGETLIDSSTDEGGRFNQSIDLKAANTDHRYELIFSTREYWKRKGITGNQLIDEIVLRFSMHDPDARYHKPVILSPNSYSTWASEAE